MISIVLLSAAFVSRGVFGDVFDGVVKDDCADETCGAAWLQRQAEVHSHPWLKRSSRSLPKTTDICKKLHTLDLTHMDNCNLGGVVSNIAEKNLRYRDAVTVDGRACDLVITNKTEYIFNNAEAGCWLTSGMANINVRQNAQVTVNFAFFYSGTQDKCIVPAVPLTVYDVDMAKKNRARETVKVCGMKQIIEGETSVLERTDAGDCTSMRATQIGYQDSNPTSAVHLTEQQESFSFAAIYENVHDFDVEIIVAPGGVGRNFLFSGENVVGDFCPKPLVDVQCDEMKNLNLDTPTYANLGGLGPDAGEAQTVNYSNVVTIGTKSCDMIVSAVGPYEASAPEMNKVVENGMAQLNVKSGTTSRLKFEFVYSGTSDKCVIPELPLTFYDIDEYKKGKARESVLICGATQVGATPESVLAPIEKDGCKGFVATTKGGGDGNPTSTTNLTEEQKSFSFTTLFQAVSEFEVEVSVAKGGSGRNFLFAGVLMEPEC